MGQQTSTHKLKCAFEEDKTIFSGQTVAPKEKFTKTWIVSNTGQEPWPSNVELKRLKKFRKIKQLNKPGKLPDKVLPGDLVDASVRLVAPGKPGEYIAEYRMYDKNTRKLFGDVLRAKIVVRR
ncbi:hypothetical protein AAMO2058_001125300 [Amorphochlora amoebiformis]